MPRCQEGIAISGLLTDESGATSLTLKGNRILRGGVGVRLADNAKGFIKENEIEGCAGAGIDVSGGAEPEVQHAPRSNLSPAPRCDLSLRAAPAPARSSSEPRPNQVAGNRLRGCGADGVRVGPGGKGRYQNNVARECAGCGVRIERDGAPDMRANELEVRSRLEP